MTLAVEASGDFPSQALPRRLARLGVAHLCFGWVATLIAPVWVLLLAPLLFGVPHILNDFRLLVLRPPAPVTRRLLIAIVGPLAALTLLRGALLLGSPRFPTLEVALGFIAVLSAAWVASKERARLRPWLLSAIVLLGVTCALRPNMTALVLGHGHNLVAIGLWLAFMHRARVSRPMQAALGLLFVTLSAGLLLGLVPIASGASVAGLSFEGLRDSLAPGLAPAAADRVVMSFAFAQLMHYSIWVFLLPACAGAMQERRSLGQVAHDLSSELGRVGIAAGLLLLIALPTLGLFDATGARSAYLSIVLFHGWLEIALIVYWVASKQGTHDSLA